MCASLVGVLLPPDQDRITPIASRKPSAERKRERERETLPFLFPLEKRKENEAGRGGSYGPDITSPLLFSAGNVILKKPRHFQRILSDCHKSLAVLLALPGPLSRFSQVIKENRSDLGPLEMYYVYYFFFFLFRANKLRSANVMESNKATRRLRRVGACSTL